MKLKKIIALSLAAFLAISPMVVKAEDVREVEIVPIKESNYINFNGKITEINSTEKSFSILAENDLENALDKLVAYISDDVVLLDGETMNFIDKESLKEGTEVSLYYSKDTPMLMSYPPQLTPNVIVVRNRKEPVNIKVDTFNKDLVSEDNTLRLNIDKEVEIIDLDGNKLEKEELTNKDLVVFYNIVAESFPAQTTPEKVIVIKNNEPTVLNKIIINGEEIELENLLYKNEESAVMVPLRQIVEELGYKVSWDQETFSAELIRDAQWTRVTIGKDNYNFAKMLIKLGTAPELKDSRTYVPISFLQEVLIANVEVTMDGVLKINQ